MGNVSISQRGSEEHKQGVERQRELFWLGEPHLVISIIQFMQFGYALALSIVIMYWETLSGSASPYWFLMAVLVCYGTFVYVLSKVLPQYTLCTSLGHLVDQKQLQETLAWHRLEEAQRLEKQKALELSYQPESMSFLIYDETTKGGESPKGDKYQEHQDHSQSTKAGSAETGDDGRLNAAQRPAPVLDISEIQGDDRKEVAHRVQDDLNLLARDQAQHHTGRRRRRKKSVSASGIIQSWNDMNATEERLQHESIDNVGDDVLTTRSGRMMKRPTKMLLAELVKADTQSLRQRLPEGKRELLVNREQQQRDRRQDRKKAFLDGVSNFRAFTKASPKGHTAADETNDPVKRARDDSFPTVKARGQRRNRKKSVSASGIIESWNAIVTEDEPNKAPSLPTSDAASISMDRVELSEEEVAAWLEDTYNKKPQPSKTAEDSFGNRPPPPTAQPQQESLLVVDNVPHPKSKDIPAIENDDATVDTGKSIDALSEVDAVSEIESVRKHSYHEEDTWCLKAMKILSPSEIRKNAKIYFLSGRYRTTTAVFGTLVVFFLIGNRVEAMIASTGVIDPSDNTWELNLFSSFWWEVTWYMVFILIGFIILFLFPLSKSKYGAEQTIVASAVMDILLSAFCLSLLVVAEIQRCCVEEDAEDGETFDFANSDNYVDSECTCPRFGSRTYEGLGNIEPFTSLIALRIFKFVFARLVIDKIILRNKQGIPSEESNEDNSSVHHLHDGHEGQSMQHETLELWEKAINEYPDIVQKYGQFSGELLRAMLGLKTIADEQPSNTISSTVVPVAGTKDLMADEKAKEENRPPSRQRPSRIKLSGMQYHDLPAEAQGMILAGKLGKPVKSVRNLAQLPALMEETHVDLNDHLRSKDSQAEFEFDTDQEALEEKTKSPFIAPNARLLRSMRRGDRKLFPLLKDWVTVDIVVTQFEIVYFDAHGVQDNSQAKSDTSSSMLALQATKGGKGLRLCDVAKGRKVVGHLNLGDVTQVHVEQDLPLADLTLLQEGELLPSEQTDLPSEFWLDPFSTTARTSRHSRQLRWAKVKEDRLKLESIHGTLVFRFYSDLDDIESHTEECASLKKDILKKDIAFQWAQTITHCCGRDQLKQDLPHYGEGNTDELRDILEIVHYHENELEETLKYLHSSASPPPRVRHSMMASSPKNLKFFKSSRSFGEIKDQSTRPNTAKGRLKRAISFSV